MSRSARRRQTRIERLSLKRSAMEAGNGAAELEEMSMDRIDAAVANALATGAGDRLIVEAGQVHDAPSRRSDGLRSELGQLDARIAGLEEEEYLSERDVGALSVAMVRGDSEAEKGLQALRAARARAVEMRRVVVDARVAIVQELRGALAVEQRAELEARSREALAFADNLAQRGAVLDKALATFRQAYLDLKSELSGAHVKGWAPSILLAEGALVQAWRSALWGAALHELRVEPPTARHRFAELTASWAGAARGSAARMLLAPAYVPDVVTATTSAAKPASGSSASEATRRRAPVTTDISTPLPGDSELGFEVREPRRA
jgi:hypothetical protein